MVETEPIKQILTRLLSIGLTYGLVDHAIRTPARNKILS